MSEIFTRIEELRKRLIERVTPLRKGLFGEEGRPALLRGEGTTNVAGQIQIGKGALIDQVTKRFDTLITTIKERRPQIIPTVVERIKAFEPGKRITELVNPPEGAPTPTAPTPTSTPTPAPTKKLLRG
jgi:hypothetical protein